MGTKLETTASESPSNVFNSLVRLWRHLAKRRKHQLGLLLLLMLAGAFSEVITLGAVLPFIGVLISPEKVFYQPIIRGIAEAVGLTSPSQLVFPLTMAFILVAFVAGVVRVVLLWGTTRLSYAVGADLSMEIYRRTLYQPYLVHVARNSSEVVSGISAKTWKTVTSIQALLNMVTSLTLLFCVMAALFAIDPVVVSIAALFFGVIYGFVSWARRKQITINSKLIARESTLVIKALQEGLGSIRDVLLNGTQKVYCEIYRKADIPWRKAEGNLVFIAGSPRFAMETLGMALIAGLAYGMSRQPGGVSSTLPILGTIALGAQRLLPALQQIYSSWVAIAGNRAVLFEVVDLLDQPVPPEATDPQPAPLELKDSIRFEAVRFRYLEGGSWVLDGLDLNIRRGARVGFVGATGSGKSTTLDLLMGLLDPSEGRILVDGTPISRQVRRAWQLSIAHVPQSIFLADSTMSENIAFGVPHDEIDMERVVQSAQQAHIADFIDSQPDGYQAFVGERGIRLSGGQRQRIGIARALYKQASVLVFDEATSSLDNETEREVMEAIESLNRDLTIILVAHRLTTVQHCDQIIEMSQGRVVAQGTYEQLIKHSPSFQKMAKAVA